jgi:hypothetical protein
VLPLILALLFDGTVNGCIDFKLHPSDIIVDISFMLQLPTMAKSGIKHFKVFFCDLERQRPGMEVMIY